MSVELVGREAELAAVSDLLAQRQARRDRRAGWCRQDGRGDRGRPSDGARPEGVERAGVWLARLETAATADDVVDTLVAALNVGGEAALFERLKRSAALIILDNCEHVVDAAATLAVRLLDAAPALRILCTSQVPLDVDGEVVFELAPLALSDAVVAVHASSQCATHDARVRVEADDAVHELCRSLDGLPSRSSSPRREPRRCRSRRSPAVSTIGSTC